MSLAPPAASPLAPGYKLDRYELLCPIAEGGMASVWIARQTGKHGFRKLVAIKTILPKFAGDERFQRMFIDESRIASRIEHESVAQILDVGEQHGVSYLVMEYVDGDALSKISRAARKKGVKVPLGILLRVMAGVCGGLHAAHELRDPTGAPMGVVHRDVSPQNVLVTTRGAAKLIDFGIAKARDRLAGDTNVDQIKGKVAYMAPEQALGRAVDRRADVWAVGAVLYHLIVGKPPYEADNDIQTLFKVSSGRPPVPLAPSHPAPVREVVMRALAHSRDSRYATCAELQQALEEAIVAAGLAVSASTVAAFLRDMVGDRADQRRDAIALGLRAAEERETYAALMQSNAEKANTGPASDASSAVTGTGSMKTGEILSSPGQTLGSAAVVMPARERSRGARVAIVGAAVGACVVVGGLAVALGVGASRGSASPAAAPRAAATAPAPPASPSPSPSPATSATAEAPPVAASATAANPASSTAPAAATPSHAIRVAPTWATPPVPATHPHGPPATTPRENYGF